jgi:hypothetical protein
VAGELLEVGLEVGCTQRHRAKTGACQRDGGRIGVVVRLEDDDLVVGAVDQREQTRRQGFGRAGRDDHLGRRVDVEPVEPALMLADGFEEVGDAAPWRVLVRAVGDGAAALPRGPLDWTVLVGEALAEIDRACSGRCCGHLCEDRRRDGSVCGEQTCTCCRAPPCAGDDTHEEQAKAIAETHLRHTRTHRYRRQSEGVVDEGAHTMNEDDTQDQSAPASHDAVPSTEAAEVAAQSAPAAAADNTAPASPAHGHEVPSTVVAGAARPRGDIDRPRRRTSRRSP